MLSKINETLYVVQDMHEAILEMDNKYPLSTRRHIVYSVILWLHDPKMKTLERKKLDKKFLLTFLVILYDSNGYKGLLNFFFHSMDDTDYGEYYEVLNYLLFLIDDYYEKRDYTLDQEFKEATGMFRMMLRIFRMKEIHEHNVEMELKKVS